MTDNELHIAELVSSYDGMEEYVEEELSEDYIAELEAEWDEISEDVDFDPRHELNEERVEATKLVLAEASLRSKEMTDEEKAEAYAFFGIDQNGDDN